MGGEVYSHQTTLTEGQFTTTVKYCCIIGKEIASELRGRVLGYLCESTNQSTAITSDIKSRPMESQLVAAARLPIATCSSGSLVLHRTFISQSIREKGRVQFRIPTYTDSDLLQVFSCRSVDLVRDYICSPKLTVGVRLNRVSQLAC